MTRYHAYTPVLIVDADTPMMIERRRCTESPLAKLHRAPWGKFIGERRNRLWGPLIPHVLGWIVMETPPVYIGIFAFKTFASSPARRFLVSLILTHYCNRGIIYPMSRYLLIHSRGSMPLGICLSALFFCFYNSIQQYSALMYGNYEKEDVLLATLQQGRLASLASPEGLAIMLGSIIFFLGMAINVFHDYSLLQSRKNGDGEGGYVLPRNGLFVYISCPHYLGEITEWWGFALASRNSGSLAFAVFTTGFLGARALQHHAWYKKRFDNFPSDRRAIVPFLL
eukprot:GHVU01067055.1.p1 GENE.GHVU01067055.1~~GHVU01067055.1.p1  ORF type:complete len:282 (-),score=0.92 GHVU01067055.1:356-1201(-)